MSDKKHRPILNEYASWALDVKRHARGTVNLYLHYLESLADHAEAHGSDIEELGREDLEAFVATYRHYAPATQAHLEPALKRSMSSSSRLAVELTTRRRGSSSRKDRRWKNGLMVRWGRRLRSLSLGTARWPSSSASFWTRD